MNRTIRPVDKPIGMFCDPGMIGRALECNVQCDLHSVRSCGGHQAVEISESAQLRVNRLVPATDRQQHLRRGRHLLAPFGRRLPMDCRAHLEARRSSCSAPCEMRAQWDEWAAGTQYRSPSQQSRATVAPHRERFHAARDSGDADRGKSSYQDENRARSRSTHTGNSTSYRVAFVKSGLRVINSTSESSHGLS